MSKKDKQEKTNAMRLIEKAGMDYTVHEYDIKDGLIDGISVARKTGVEEARCFKTLVARDNKGELYVFVIPVSDELDLKKAARHFGAKKIEMIHVKEINGLTGYVRGGCSPIGMKKQYLTCIDEKALEHDKIAVSGGKKGLQIEMDPEDIAALTSADFDELVK